MWSQGRKVLLLLDNAPFHCEMELDNVKFVFLPANTTAGTQPLDAGIIKDFKVFYHKYLLDHLISELMDQDVIITTKGIHIKMMVKWIATAWNDIIKH